MNYDRSPFPESSWWLWAVAAALIAGLFWGLAGCQGQDSPVDPPPGYSIVCNEDGHYGIKMPSGYIIAYPNLDPDEPMKTKQEAVDRAWAQYNFAPRPEKVQKWKTCGRGEPL